jgi:ribosomal-protein-alanine N-acetyltransferase
MVLIEEMKAADIIRVCEIEQEAFPGNAWGQELFHKEVKNPSSLTALLREKKELIGYIIIGVAGPEASLLKLAIRPSCQRKGYGSLLLNHVMDKLRGMSVEKIFLEVRDSNKAAQSLYAKAGFEPVSRRKAYYPDNEDALIMALSL